MPKESSDYSKACVYGIFQYDKIHYIGSTKNFAHRKSEHKSKCNNDKSSKNNLPLYKCIRDSGGWENGWQMVLLQEYPNCKSSQELLTYEREYYEKLNPDLNAQIPILTDDERKVYRSQYDINNKQKLLEQNKIYYEENKEKIAEHSKIYRLKNKEKIAEQTKLYYEENKEKIGEKQKHYYQNNKERNLEQRKQYLLDNKEKLAETAKKYYQNNKERILEQQKKQRSER